MRDINRSAVLDLIHRQGPLSRTTIAKKINISLPTVMRIVAELEKERLVIPIGINEKSRGKGRKGELFAFNATEHLTLGVDLGGTKMYGAVADLAGNILYEETISHHQTSGEDSYQRLKQLIQSLSSFAKQTGKHIRGIGIGAPGVTYYEEGVVQWAPSLGWRDYPLKAKITSDFGLPTIVDNDVNLAALGETWFGAGQQAHSLVVIAIGTGIGSGIVIDGNIYRGSHQAAGEIGYLVPEPRLLGKPYNEFGAFEGLASGSGIAERARQALAGQMPKAELARLSSEDVFEAARRHENWACRVIAETVDYLAKAVVAVYLCLDPDLVILGGGVARSADLLIEPILQRLTGVIPIPPTLVASALGYRATVLGAVVNLLYNTANFYVVKKLV